MALKAEIVAVIDGEVRRLDLDVTQLVLRDVDGNPVMIAGEYGGDHSSVVSHIGDDDFIRTLNAFGVRITDAELQVERLDVSRIAPP